MEKESTNWCILHSTDTYTHAYNKNKHEKGEEEEAKRFDFDKSSNEMMLLLSPLLTKINVFTI